MGSAVSIDGALVNPESASVPVLDRGFLYGDSAFEVTRTYAGQPFALGLHLEQRFGLPWQFVDQPTGL